MGKVVTVTISFFVLGALFWVLESRWPSVPGQKRAREGFKTDIAYWFFTSIVGRGFVQGALYVTIAVIAVGSGMVRDPSQLFGLVHRPGLLSHQPVWLQMVEALLLGDLLGYIIHRWFHLGRAWRFHAVHHCSTQLDWLSSVRLHPLNQAANQLFSAVPLFLLGLRADVLGAYLPFLVLWSIFIHANVPWSLGPLRYVLSSPAFHRWHHTSQEQGLNKNFAGLFPFIDWAFGTLYLSAESPQRFGVSEQVPTTLWAQMIYPFRRRPVDNARVSENLIEVAGSLKVR